MSLDPIDVSRLLAGYLVSPRLAVVVGPYSLIFLLALAGAALSLANRKSTGRVGSFVYLLVNTVIGLVGAVPGSTWVAAYSAGWEAQWFFLPLAFCLAYMGDRWKDLLAVLLEALKEWIRNWAAKGAKP